jgi:hypothetical protein
MAEFDFSIDGLRELQQAVQRNPGRTVQEVGKFLQRGLAAYRRIINNSPWRLEMSGGGAPVASGHLRDSHRSERTPWTGRIFPTAPYAAYVHGIDGWPRKKSYQLRPWLEYAETRAEGDIEKLQDEMLNNIVEDLAK